MSDHLKSLSQVYLEQIAESAEKVNVKYDPHMDLMAPQVEEEEVEQIGEDIRSEKGKAKMKSMLAARTTDSGRAKPGKGQNVKDIKHIGRANVDGYGGTPSNRKMAKNPLKSNFTGLRSSAGEGGNKAKRRAGQPVKDTRREEVELDENRRAARAAGGYKDDSKKQTDPSKDGFTGIGNMSIDQIRKMSARIERDKKKTKSEEVEHIDEAPYQIYGSSDGKKKEKKIGKPVKNKSYADARASELENTHKSSGGKYGMKTTRVQYTETLDPVGKEDADVDNDGKKNDSNDKYIMKRRAAIRKAIAKKKVSEGLSTDVENPSTDLKKLVAKAVKRIDTDVDGDVENNDKSKGKFGEFIPSADGKGRVYTKVKEELVIEVSGEDKEEKIKEKKVNNKITINPELKESISEIGGEVLFISEVEEIDSIVESVHIELIEEGYSEEQVVEALKYAIDEVTNPAKVASFKMKKAKYSPKSETKKEPKKSLKDRIKSVARKALDTAGGAVGKVMKKKAQIQAAPAKAKKKLGSYVDRAKAVAKAGYDRERGPVEKKSTSYRGAGVGRKEKIGEEVATDPKMQQLQKKQIHLDRQKLSARVQAMQKKKPAPEQQQEAKNDPCWDSHKMVGMKKKGGKMVPNCVPKEETENVGEEMTVKQQMEFARKENAKRKPYKAGDHRKANLKKAHVRKPTEREKESSGRYTGGYAGD